MGEGFFHFISHGGNVLVGVEPHPVLGGSQSSTSNSQATNNNHNLLQGTLHWTPFGYCPLERVQLSDAKKVVKHT
jgi:hypothetical protein